MASLPTGTVTFLFTDIEGSTQVLQRLGDHRYAEVLAEHQRLLRDALAEGHGQVVDTQGDALLVAFSRARDALATAVAAQRALTKHSWPDGASLRVRMGLHTGEPVTETGGYVGLDLHRAARICAAGHGGQILLSDAVSGLAARDLPPGVSLRDLGSHRLKDLQEPEHLLQVVHPDLPADFPPVKSLDVLPNNLPVQLTSFIGREREKAEVCRLLSTSRLVTLTGTGGAGKTRLALQVGADLLDQYPDGVWFVELAPLSDPALVPKTVASALDVPEQPGRQPLETLVRALPTKHLLLALDNCEHVFSACQDLANTLLRACPHLRMLATSREALGVDGEVTYRVPSLQLPDLRRLPPPASLVEYEAIRLFAERAALSQPGFSLTASNAASVAQICHRLDGIPLAIEFAAARVKVLSMDQIATRLDDRFRLLTAGTRKTLPRHQTLRATMDWSYDLLSEQERTVLRRLSVFAGGWTLEAAEAVCSGNGVETSDVLDLLTQLVDKSLVVAETKAGGARYRLLETVRQYALDRLLEAAEATALQGRHFEWYLALAERAEPELFGAREEVWSERLEREHDNLRLALEWGVADVMHEEAVLRLAGALAWFWHRRTYASEGRLWLTRVLRRGGAAAAGVRAKALGFAGFTACFQGDYQQAAALGRESLDLYEELGDKRGIAMAKYQLGCLADFQGDPAEAKQLFLECLALFQQIGSEWGIASVLNNLGEVARGASDYDAARSFYEESLAIARGAGLQSGIANATANLGNVFLHQGKYMGAAKLLRDALVLYSRLGDTRNISALMGGLAGVSMAESKPERAARLLGSAEALRERVGVLVSSADQALYEHQVGFARSALSENALAVAWAEGRAMTLEQAIEYAMTEDAGAGKRYHD